MPTIADDQLRVPYIKADGTRSMTGPLNLNGQKINGVADPTSAQDAATKSYTDTQIASLQSYVDGKVQGLTIKDSVRVATTANITLSGTQTIDSVAVIAGNRVLVKDQTTASQNGIYVVAAGSWSRAADADTGTELLSAFTFVQEGTVNQNSGWVQTTDGTITIGSTSIAWSQFSGAGQITAGTGLSKSGNTLNVTVDTTTVVINGSNQVAVGNIDASKVNAGTLAVARIGNVLTGGTANATSGQVFAGDGTFKNMPVSNREKFTGDGTTLNFDMTKLPGALVMVYRNGLLQEPGAGGEYTYTAAGGTNSAGRITFGTAPLSGDVVTVIY